MRRPETEHERVNRMIRVAFGTYDSRDYEGSGGCALVVLAVVTALIAGLWVWS
jgi:hypothetical protein